jgi:WD40 repeat protein
MQQVWFHDEPVHAVAFSPDGNFLLSAGADKTARIWNVATGESIGPPWNMSAQFTRPDSAPMAAG